MDYWRNNPGTALRGELAASYPLYAEQCLKIMPKAGGLVAFIFNAFQYMLHEALEARKRAVGYVRAVILKPRQLGCSTYIDGRNYHLITLASHQEFVRRGQQCLIMTHEDKSTTHIFRILKTFHETCRREFRPDTKASNAIELIFDNKNGTGLKCEYLVQTANSKGGRSLTPRYLHLSEFAYYGEGGMQAVSGAMAGMPSEADSILGTEVIIESTAHGVGEPFHEMWVENRGLEKRGKRAEYMTFFFPWFHHPPYRAEVTPEERCDIEGGLDDDEQWLLRQSNLDGSPVAYEQLAWRRMMIRTLKPPAHMTREDFFRQENPATPDEAFIYSGANVFPPQYVKAEEQECFAPIEVGDFERSTGRFIVNHGAKSLRIWQRPRRGELYVIGADVAEGITKGDYSCADVLHVPTGKQVAQWHGHVDPDIFGDILYYLGYYYGPARPALLGVEANNHGHTVINRLIRKRYPALYQRETVDGPQGRKIKKYGFLSTGKSKNRIIDQLGADLRDGESGIHCKETIDEIRQYSILPDGSYGAPPSGYDDRVMSRAIAGEMLLQQTPMRRSQEDEQWKMAS